MSQIFLVFFISIFSTTGVSAKMSAAQAEFRNARDVLKSQAEYAEWLGRLIRLDTGVQLHNVMGSIERGGTTFRVPMTKLVRKNQHGEAYEMVQHDSLPVADLVILAMVAGDKGLLAEVTRDGQAQFDLNTGLDTGMSAVVLGALKEVFHYDITKGGTPLMWALRFLENENMVDLAVNARDEHPDHLRRWLRKSTPDPAEIRDIAAFLINHETTDVSAVDDLGLTAFHHAARARDIPTLKLLLEKGVDINHRSSFSKQTALLYMYSHATIDPDIPPHATLEVAKFLVDRGAHVDISDKWNGSALMLVALNDDEEAVRFFLDHGADVNKQGGTFGSALGGVSALGTADVASLLLEYGAHVDNPNTVNLSNLHVAVTNRNIGVVRVLLDHGADINRKITGGGYAGYYPLDLAIMQEDTPMIEFLRARGISNSVD